MQTQPKAPPTVAIGLLEDPEDLEPANDMLDLLSEVRQHAVLVPLLFAQRTVLFRLVRGERERVIVGHALIPGVSDERRFRMHPHA